MYDQVKKKLFSLGHLQPLTRGRWPLGKGGGTSNTTSTHMHTQKSTVSHRRHCFGYFASRFEKREKTLSAAASQPGSPRARRRLNHRLTERTPRDGHFPRVQTHHSQIIKACFRGGNTDGIPGFDTVSSGVANPGHTPPPGRRPSPAASSGVGQGGGGR